MTGQKQNTKTCSRGHVDCNPERVYCIRWTLVSTLVISGDSDQSPKDGDDTLALPHERIEDDEELKLHCMGNKYLFTKSHGKTKRLQLPGQWQSRFECQHFEIYNV